MCYVMHGPLYQNLLGYLGSIQDPRVVANSLTYREAASRDQRHSLIPLYLDKNVITWVV